MCIDFDEHAQNCLILHCSPSSPTNHLMFGNSNAGAAFELYSTSYSSIDTIVPVARYRTGMLSPYCVEVFEAYIAMLKFWLHLCYI